MPRSNPTPSLAEVTITSPDRYRTICTWCHRESDQPPGKYCGRQYAVRCNGILREVPREER